MGADRSRKGPIIRVNPQEVHIRDPHYYSTIYGFTHATDKYENVTLATGMPTALTGTIDHYHHRARRGYLKPYFTKRAIIDMESMVHERAARLCGRLDDAQQSGQIVGLDSAFSSLTADLIIQRFYGYHMDYLGIPDFRCVVTDAFLGANLAFHFARFFPKTAQKLQRMPIWLLKFVQPALAQLQLLREETKAKISSGMGQEKTEDFNPNGAILTQALNDKRIPPQERELDRLLDEGILLIFAGTETTSRALSFIFFYLLRDRSLLKRLREELQVLPRRPDHEYSSSELEHLPFLVRLSVVVFSFVQWSFLM